MSVGRSRRARRAAKRARLILATLFVPGTREALAILGPFVGQDIEGEIFVRINNVRLL